MQINLKNKINKCSIEINNKIKYNTQVYDEKIKKVQDFIKINELVYNTFNLYKEDYYNNLNVINLIQYYRIKSTKKKNIINENKNSKDNKINKLL